MTKPNQESRCSGVTKSGKPCRAAATEGGLCFFHANPNKAAELGRIGGRKNGRMNVGCNPLPELDTVNAVREAVKQLISDVYTGKLNSRTAAGLAPLLHLQMRAIEKTDFEQRITKMEKHLARLKADMERTGQEKQPVERESIYKRPPQGIKPSSSENISTGEES